MAVTPVLSTDSLPPARPRPVQWRRLKEQLAVLWEADPAKVLDAAFSTGDAIGGMSDERQLRRILASDEGRSIVVERASLTEALADHAALRAMPRGSLGRAFLAFSEHHGLDPRALIESQHRMSRDYAHLDPVRQWISDRLTVMHDLWHVIAGYDATHAGESALMCFSLPQRVNDRALPIFVVMSLLAGRISPRNAWEAFVRGKRVVLLAAQPLEQLLPQPLEAVREHLGVTPPGTAHPRETSEAMLIRTEPQAG